MKDRDVYRVRPRLKTLCTFSITDLRLGAESLVLLKMDQWPILAFKMNPKEGYLQWMITPNMQENQNLSFKKLAYAKGTWLNIPMVDMNKIKEKIRGQVEKYFSDF